MGGEINAHYEVFTHHAVCHAYQTEALLARERRAKAEAWQLTKRLNRLQRTVHRGVRRIGEGRAGVLTATRVLDSVKQVLRPSPHERPITS